MPRKGSVPKRKVLPDYKYGDVSVTKTINAIMRDGKKSKAEKIFYGAMDIIAKKTGKDPHEVFTKALGNIKPSVEVRPRRVGGATYQVPMEVNHFRRQSLAIRWLIQAARSGKGPMMERLASEILDAAEGRGAAVKKKEDTHRMAEANRAFAHYRW